MWPFDRSEEDKEKDNQAQEVVVRQFTYCCVCNCPFEVEDLIVKLYRGRKHSEGVYVRSGPFTGDWVAAFAHIDCTNPSTSN